MNAKERAKKILQLGKKDCYTIFGYFYAFRERFYNGKQ